MPILPLVVGAVMLVVLVAGLLNYFGNRVEHAWYVSFVAFISWFFPFSIVFLVPLDLSSTLWRDCKEEDMCREPFFYVSSEFLIAAWRTIYWCSFVLTWVMIPLLQEYSQSGEFTVMKRFRHAIRYNIIYQLIIGSIALLGLIYVWYSQGSSNLRAYIMALSNSWGLILVIIFMGYGMVDVPRRLWHKGDNERELKRIAFKASAIKDKKQDTEDDVYKVAKELSVVCHKVQLSDPLRPYVNQMVEDFPVVRGVQFESSRTVSPILSSQNQRGGGTTDLLNAADGGAGSGGNYLLGISSRMGGTHGRKNPSEGLIPQVITEKYLADLHARIKRALRMKDRWTAIWHDLLKAGFLAQDIQENADNPEKKFRSTLRPLISKSKERLLSFEWHWYLRIRPILLRSLSVLCAILSLLIVWSEMTYQSINPILSVIGLLVQLSRDHMSYGAIEAISFFIMLYMCICAYTTLMKMKLLSNYVLVPNHHTDEPTLLFIGSYLCRLTFPLVYNYLTISAVGKEDSTEFQAYMGKIDMIPLLGEFNYYMPYAILVPTLITLFNVFAKMFALCTISDHFFNNDDDDGGIGGDLEEGLQVLKDARRDEERLLLPDRVGLNRDFTARRGAAFESYNNNKKRRRGETPVHSILGNEGSSTNVWRDLRPHPSSGANQRAFQDPYYDDSTDEDESHLNNLSGGYGRRESLDPYAVISRRNSFDGTWPYHHGNRGPLGGTASNRSSHRNLSHFSSGNHAQQQRVPLSSSNPGPFKTFWQKLIKPKQAIALGGPTGVRTTDPMDSDSARSSIESTGHNDYHQQRHQQQQHPYPHHPHHSSQRGSHRPESRNTLGTSATSSRTGPALMLSSQQQPSHYGHYGRSLQDDDRDRERLLSSNDTRMLSSGGGGSGRNSAYSSRTVSPQGRVAAGPLYQYQQQQQQAIGGNSGGRKSRPNSRVFGSNIPISGGGTERGNGNTRSVPSSHRQASPLIHINDEDG